ncbi:helix-turn-helix transcriptional regulator [uncultured Roseibium sp.]|uniref:AraC family transcriptional regulator n=1 Tax=uncultured Roseibium sp. TaxID=1936171 RepID=UPI003216FC7B
MAASGDIDLAGFGRSGWNPFSKPHFVTSDYRIAQDHLEKSSKGLFQLSVPQNERFRQYSSKARLLGESRVTLVNIDSEAGYRIAMNADPDLIYVQVLLQGSALYQQRTTRVEVRSAQLVLQEARALTRKDWGGPTQLMAFRLSRRALERLAAQTMGDVGSRPLDFDTIQVIDLERVPTLWHHILMIYNDLQEPMPFLNGPSADHAEQILLHLLLQSIPNSYDGLQSSVPAQSAAPYYVRRVETFIREHAREQIDIQDMIQTAGVSERSVYLGFRRFRNTTPMAYLKEVRLNLARRALLEARADKGMPVTGIALDCGYENPSQFSRDYRARFHETPTETVRRASRSEPLPRNDAAG